MTRAKLSLDDLASILGPTDEQTLLAVQRTHAAPDEILAAANAAAGDLETADALSPRERKVLDILLERDVQLDERTKEERG